MTPKEKAKELFSVFEKVNGLKYIDYNGLWDTYYPLTYDDAKACALIAVDQMLWVAEWYERRHKTDSVIQYLNKVKTEIEKL